MLIYCLGSHRMGGAPFFHSENQGYGILGAEPIKAMGE
jgi:hypothetical protein